MISQLFCSEAPLKTTLIIILQKSKQLIALVISHVIRCAQHQMLLASFKLRACCILHITSFEDAEVSCKTTRVQQGQTTFPTPNWASRSMLICVKLSPLHFEVGTSSTLFLNSSPCILPEMQIVFILIYIIILTCHTPFRR